jgi:phosphate transport system substrate-binding protein
MKKLISLLLVSATLLLCGSSRAAEHITVKGSDTMVILAQKWAETYMKAHKDVTVMVTGGGSGTGIAALINGTTTLANCSRPIKPKETKDAMANNITPVEYKVAMDALAVIVNAQNPVNELSMNQLGAIYTGRISNWKEVGGPDHRIMRYSRESNSGTYVFFKEHVMQDKDYAPDCQNMPGTSAVAEAVSKDSWGIGYGGVAYFAKMKELRILRVKKDNTSKGVSPLKQDGTVDFEAVWKTEYPVARYLYCYSAGKPSAKVQEYLNWILSKEGQTIVEEIGYVPLNK